MHTLVATLVGFIALGFYARLSKPLAAGARRFIGVWLGACILHLGYGVLGAGYSLVSELGVHAIVFGLPAITAWILSRKLPPSG